MILADPSNDTPPIFLAVSNAVAVSALPVVSWFRVATLAAATVPEAMLEPLIAVILAPLPTKLDAVTIPAAEILPLAAMVAAVPTFTLVTVIVGFPLNHVASPVTLPVKGPVNLDEVTIPENVALPLDDMVAADPTLNDVAVRFPVKSRPVEDVSAFTLLL